MNTNFGPDMTWVWHGLILKFYVSISFYFCIFIGSIFNKSIQIHTEWTKKKMTNNFGIYTLLSEVFQLTTTFEPVSLKKIKLHYITSSSCWKTESIWTKLSLLGQNTKNRIWYKQKLGMGLTPENEKSFVCSTSKGIGVPFRCK